MTRNYAVVTPKPCQDRKVAAIRDACDRRGLRVISLQGEMYGDKLFVVSDRLMSLKQIICRSDKSVTLNC